MLQFYGQPWLLYYQFLSDDEDGRLQIMLAKIDTSTLQPGQPKELFLLEKRSAGPYRSLEALNMPPLGILASPDSSKILVYWASLAGSDLFIDVLDRRLDRILSKEEQIRPGGALELQSMGVTDRGNVF
ncbi:MAG: hypothetical protein Q8932_00600, partial [Bacteroidota bacterium]|nr:hypothetical protein [Bacteroidota bacterium]